MRRVTLIAIIFSSLVFGTNFIFTKQLLPPFDAFGFLFFRSVIGVLSLLAVFTIRRGKLAEFKRLFAREFKRLFVLGLVFYFGCNFIVYFAVPLTLASHVTILQQFGLVSIFLVDVLVMKKIPPRLLWIAAALNTIGMLCIIFPLDLSGNPLLLGDLLAILSVLASTGFSFKLKSASECIPPEYVSLALALFTIVGALPVMLVQLAFGWNDFVVVAVLDPTQWVFLIWLGIGISGIGYWLHTTAYADPEITPEHMGIISNLTIVTGVAISVLFFGEILTWWNWAGIGLILASVYLSQVKERKKAMIKNNHNFKD
nr:EamA family transporter [Candidatus Sigynarchaeota archaeon]